MTSSVKRRRSLVTSFEARAAVHWPSRRPTATVSTGAASSRVEAQPQSATTRSMRIIAFRCMASHSDPAGELAPLLEHPERSRRARHQEAIAARDQALDVLGVRMRVAAWHVVVLADLENAVDGLGYHGVLVLARVAELLAQIPFPDQHHADALHLLENLREVLDRLDVLALDDDEDLALGRQRPDVGARIVVRLGETPVAGRAGRCIAADPRRVVERRTRQAWIAAGADGGARLFHGAPGRGDDPVQPHVEPPFRDSLGPLP